MKRIIIIATLLLASMAAFAQNGKSIYQKYSDAENVSAVYISPAMFRLIGKIPDLKLEGEDVNLAPLIQSLSGLYILDSENSSINAKIKADTESFIKGGEYELLMEAKEHGESVRMYTAGTEKIVNSFVMLSIEGEDLSFICIDGKMDRESLEKMLLQ
ncbi:MAG: DUF4252 domain-containing protein [Bacteroidales bacterium]|nr:DUF4252 domain-containing protein [Bacteroidales bacterium]